MLETIKISADTELGYIIINLLDYDVSKHLKYSETISESLETLDLEESVIENKVTKKRTTKAKA